LASQRSQARLARAQLESGRLASTGITERDADGGAAMPGRESALPSRGSRSQQSPADGRHPARAMATILVTIDPDADACHFHGRRPIGQDVRARSPRTTCLAAAASPALSRQTTGALAAA
jgi:hypothetical protein